MKLFVQIFALFFIPFTLIAQFKLSNLKSMAWLPEAYVNSNIKNDTSAYRNLMPIEGLENPFMLGIIKVFGVEAMMVKTKTVMQKGVEKQLITSLNAKLLTKDSTNMAAIQLSRSSVCISMVGDKLLLEIIGKEKKQAIWFASQIEGYSFKSIESAKKYLIEH